jgi:hypothetical protein
MTETYIPTTIVGKRLVAQLEPWMTPDLALYCDALGIMFQSVAELVEEVGTDGEPEFMPPYGKLFDPDLCPYDKLGYLAQYVGVTIPITASEPEARALIKEEQGFTRGTLASIEVAVRKSLTGAKAFQIVERRNAANKADAYWFLILVYEAGELPSQAVLETNVNAVKPGGVFYTIIVGSLTYAILEAAHGLHSESEAAHTTYSDAEANPTK